MYDLLEFQGTMQYAPFLLGFPPFVLSDTPFDLFFDLYLHGGSNVKRQKLCRTTKVRVNPPQTLVVHTFFFL